MSWSLVASVCVLVCDCLLSRFLRDTEPLDANLMQARSPRLASPAEMHKGCPTWHPARASGLPVVLCAQSHGKTCQAA